MIRALLVAVALFGGFAVLVHALRGRILAWVLPRARAGLRAQFGDGTELAGAALDGWWTLTVTGLRVPAAGGVIVEIEEARVARVLAALLPGGLAAVRVLEARGHVVWVGDEGPLSSVTVPVVYRNAGESARHPVDGRVEVMSAAWAHRREDLGAPPVVSGEAGVVADARGVTLSGARLCVGDMVIEGEAQAGGATGVGGGVAAKASVRQVGRALLEHLVAVADPALEIAWPEGVGVEGEVDLAPGGAVRMRARVGTAESAIAVDAEVAADRELAGRVSGKLAMADALAMGLFPAAFRPLPTGEMMIDARLAGTLGAPVVAGTAFTPAAELAAGPPREFPVYRFADTRVGFELALAGERLAWKELSTSASSGRLSGSGSVEYGIWPAQHETEIAWVGVRVEQVPTGPGGERALNTLLRAECSGKARVVGEGGDLDLLRAEGELMLIEPEYLFLRKVEPALAGYGLPAPSWKGTTACRCRLAVENGRLELSEITGRLDGLSFAGRIVVAVSGAVSGRLAITLEPSYLARSKALAMGAALGTVEVPVTITGPLTSPSVSVQIAETIGGLLKGTRMGVLASAAWQLFGEERGRRDEDAEMDRVFDRILAGGEEADRLIDRLVAAGMTADELRERLAEYRRRRGL